MDLVHLHTIYLIISILLNRLQSCCKLLNLLYLVFCHLLNVKVLFRFSINFFLFFLLAVNEVKVESSDL